MRLLCGYTGRGRGSDWTARDISESNSSHHSVTRRDNPTEVGCLPSVCDPNPRAHNLRLVVWPLDVESVDSDTFGQANYAGNTGLMGGTTNNVIIIVPTREGKGRDDDPSPSSNLVGSGAFRTGARPRHALHRTYVLSYRRQLSCLSLLVQPPSQPSSCAIFPCLCARASQSGVCLYSLPSPSPLSACGDGSYCGKLGGRIGTALIL